MRKATEARAYVSFINQRDKVLEKILLNSQRRQSDILRACLTAMIECIRSQIQFVDDKGIVSGNAQDMRKRVEPTFDHLISITTDRLVLEIKDLRRKSYVLARVGEAEAIGRAQGSNAKYYVTTQDISPVVNRDAFAGGKLNDRVTMYLARIKTKLLDRMSIGILTGSTREEILRSCVSALPKTHKLKYSKVIGRPIREANQKEIRQSMSVGFVSDDEWAALVKDYKSEYVPIERGPKWVVGESSYDINETYAWELEKDVNEELVLAVRSGEVAAATENGVVDMMWIAVIDDKTDECCVWRDGLTSTEIEEELAGDHEDDESDAIVPPAHFNCRCRMAPALEAISDEPESNSEEFLQWLES